MNLKITFCLLTVISLKSIGQTADPLTKNQWIEKQIGLSVLNKSANEIDLRIFLNRGIANGGSIIQIAKNRKGWTGTRYDYILKIKKEVVTEKIAKTTKTELTSHNWDSLWMSLKDLHITSLPSQNDIRNKMKKEVQTDRGIANTVLVVSDGSSYDLTLLFEDQTLGFSFSNPWIYYETFTDVDELRDYSQIIETIESEFQIRFRN